MVYVVVGAASECLNDGINFENQYTYKEHIGLVHDYFSNNKNNIFNFFKNYLRDQTSKMVHQLWVQRLNVLMQLFGNGFFISCRAWCSLVHHIMFFLNG